MAQEPKELQLYHVRFNSHQSQKWQTHIAVKAKTSGTMDDALELAMAVRDQINADTGMMYEMTLIDCIGTIYIWRTI